MLWDENESDPISDIKEAIEKIQKQIGYISPDPFFEVHLKYWEKAITKSRSTLITKIVRLVTNLINRIPFCSKWDR